MQKIERISKMDNSSEIDFKVRPSNFTFDFISFKTERIDDFGIDSTDYFDESDIHSFIIDDDGIKDLFNPIKKEVHPHFIILDTPKPIVTSSFDQSSTQNKLNNSNELQKSSSSSPKVTSSTVDFSLNLLSVQDTLEKLKNIKIIEFDTKKINVDYFLKSFESQMNELQIGSDHFLLIICRYLDTNAINFYSQLISKHPDINWTEFKVKFRNHFINNLSDSKRDLSEMKTEKPDSINSGFNRDHNSTDSSVIDQSLFINKKKFGSVSSSTKIDKKQSDSKSKEDSDEDFQVSQESSEEDDTSSGSLDLSEEDFDEEIIESMRSDEGSSEQYSNKSNERKNLRKKENEKNMNDKLRRRTIIEKYLRDNYERTEDKNDYISSSDIVNQLSVHLASLGETLGDIDSKNRHTLCNLLNNVFKEGLPSFKKQKEGAKIRFYACLKAKRNDEDKKEPYPYVMTKLDFLRDKKYQEAINYLKNKYEFTGKTKDVTRMVSLKNRLNAHLKNINHRILSSHMSGKLINLLSESINGIKMQQMVRENVRYYVGLKEI